MSLNVVSQKNIHKEKIMAEKKDNGFSLGKAALALLALVLVLQIPFIGPFLGWAIGAVFSLFVGGYAVEYLVKQWGGSISLVIPQWVFWVGGFFFASLAIPLAVITWFFKDDQTFKEFLN